MATRTIEVPEEILRLLEGSRLSDRPEADRVKVALAIHLLQEDVVSVGKAAELAEVPRVSFESLLIELGIPTVRYDSQEAADDARTIAQLEQRRRQT